MPDLDIHLLSAPWALQERYLSRLSAADFMSTRTMARGKQSQPIQRGAVAIIPMHGLITQRASVWSTLLGTANTSTVGFTDAFRHALADESIASIVIDIDSPGGSVYGVAELANEIYQARSQKPIYAVANSMAASAAYWIGSAASEFIVTPGGEAGSIGVYTEHQDFSKAVEKAGIRFTFISAGKYKVEGNPYEPLGGEAKNFMQTSVNNYYGMFTRAVAKHRGCTVTNVRSGFGQGRTLGAKDAVKEGLADRIATLDDVIKLAKGGGSTRRPASAQSSIRQAMVAAAHRRREIELAQFGGS